MIDGSGGSVAILLCTYNGAEFLAEQLDSIERQTHRDWVVYASDDGSSDATLDILRSYQGRFGSERLVILQGPCRGFSSNFMSLVRNSSVRADFYAFCDQDDVWYSDKLERGLIRLRASSREFPALYCSRTRIVDGEGFVLGLSPLFSKRPSFANALVQSLAGANTMILNDHARALLGRTPEDAHVVSHDWLAYLMVSGVGGDVFYDSEPGLDYRQHGRNLIGANGSVLARVRRMGMMLSGRFRKWSACNIYALSSVESDLTAQNREALRCFESARQVGLLRRLYLLKLSGVYRQTALGNFGLVFAACIGGV